MPRHRRVAQSRQTNRQHKLQAAAASTVCTMEAVEHRTLFAAAPVLGPELVLPGDTTPALSIGSQTKPTLAEGPDGTSLAVWQDTRSGGNPNVPFGVGLGTQTDIYAARIRADGSVIDVTPIPVSIASYNQTDAKAAWNGTNWLVAWTSPRDNDPYETDIKAVRISPQGAVLDQQALTIGTHIPQPQASNDIDPSPPLEIVSDGTDWVVTYERHNPSIGGGIGMEWFAVKVLANGSVPNQEGVKTLVADQYGDSYGFTFSPVNGGQYLHTFQNGSGQIYTQRFDRNLSKVGGVAAVNSELIDRVSVAGGPNGWLMATEWDNGSWHQIFAQRINADGTFYDTTPLVVNDSQYANDVSLDASWNGVDWTLAYSGSNPGQGGSGQDIFVCRVDPTARGTTGVITALVDATPIDNHQSNPQLVSTGDGGVKLVYVSDVSTKPGISVAIVSASNQVLSANDASLAAPSQAGSRLASDGNNFLMVFGSSNAYGTRLLAQRVNPQGVALDAEPFVIADVGEKVGAYEAVYFDGRYVVIYGATNGVAGKQIYARTFGTDGQVGSTLR